MRPAVLSVWGTAWQIEHEEASTILVCSALQQDQLAVGLAPGSGFLQE